MIPPASPRQASAPAAVPIYRMPRTRCGACRDSAVPEFGVSDWVVVSQERIDRFAEATGDDQWIHVDVARARRELPYGTTIAHGLLTLSLLPAFFPSVLRIEGLKNSLNYGSDRVRYLNPVPA